MAGATHVVQFKNALTEPSWQPLMTITGDGASKQVTDALGQKQRFYRITNQ